MLKEILILIFIADAVMLILHEMESAFEKEWEIFKLPGGISFFLLLHIPILFFLLYGVVLLERNAEVGFYWSIVAGIGGMVPLVVHKVLVRRSDRFNRPSSNILLVANCASGVALVVLSIAYYGSLG